jgi:protein-tyrosine phosphatase
MSLRARSAALIGTVAGMTTSPTTLLSNGPLRRRVELDGSHNFRDLGGYQLADGRRIREGRLFRADGLANLSDHDIEVIDGLGIRTVIDLRSSTELDERGRFPVERHPVSFHHLPIIDATWAETDMPQFDDNAEGAVEFLVWAYRDMLEAGGDRFAHAIKVLALPGMTPAVFHCAAGKDRTGILAALILGGLGVDDDVIADDYALTAIGMERMRGWLEANAPDGFKMMNERPSFMFSSDPAAIRRVLADLRAVHGSVASYLSSIGAGAAVMADLADQLTS